MTESVRDIFLSVNILYQVLPTLWVSDNIATIVRVGIWGDGKSFLKLGSLVTLRMTPISKHYVLKYHCFRLHIFSNNYQLKLINSCNQITDIITKHFYSEE